MAKMSRTKGKRSELEAVHFIRDNYGYVVRRGDCFRHEPDIVGLRGLHVEVKNHKTPDVGSWYLQSKDASMRYNDGIAIVMHKANRTPWYVTLAYSDWLRMGGDEAWMDKRQRFDLMAVLRENGGVRYIRKDIDLLTVKAEEFFDVYGGWIHG